ncbi:hypothetical protein PSHT_02019 [Puccinia striiformis]|uniref:RING-type domain-containing protein n=1 Tax=Puccinia striiformis TaxID=27350 RepID=A0A2S4WJ19_9BASI|nr:hypothetical protein PSHT_02019 [Puccinia striiformis]
MYQAPSLLKTSSWTPRASQGPADTPSCLVYPVHWSDSRGARGQVFGINCTSRTHPTYARRAVGTGGRWSRIDTLFPYNPNRTNLLTGPPKLRQSEHWPQSAATSHHDSHEPDSAEKLQSIVTERPAETDQTTKSSPPGSNINATGGGTASQKMDCAICLGEFDITALEDETLVPDQPALHKLEPCSHIFHQECIVEWLKRDPSHTCPHCRKEPQNSPVTQDSNSGCNSPVSISDQFYPGIWIYPGRSLRYGSRRSIGSGSREDIEMGVTNFQERPGVCTYKAVVIRVFILLSALVLTIVLMHLAGTIFGLDSPPLGQLSERAYGGYVSLPSLDTTSIEPNWPTESPPVPSRSGGLANASPPVQCDSNEPDVLASHRHWLNNRKGKIRYQDQAPKGSSIRVLDQGSASRMGECAVCLEEFNFAALWDEELIPNQPPLRQLVACFHTYHRGCIDKWLADPSKTCPHCRTVSQDDIIRPDPGHYPHYPRGSGDTVGSESHGHIETGLTYEESRAVCFCFSIIIPMLSALFWLSFVLVLSHYHGDTILHRHGYLGTPKDALLVVGGCFTLDSPHEQIRPMSTMGQWSERAGEGDVSFTPLHTISIEPNLPTGSPLRLSHSADLAHSAAVHHAPSVPVSSYPMIVATKQLSNLSLDFSSWRAELRPIADERLEGAEEKHKGLCQGSRPSMDGSCIRIRDGESAPTMVACAICLDKFDIAALDDEEIVPDQPPLLQLGCFHTFHKECIEPWFKKDPRNTCPLCRAASPHSIITSSPDNQQTALNVETAISATTDVDIHEMTICVDRFMRGCIIGIFLVALALAILLIHRSLMSSAYRLY